MCLHHLVAWVADGTVPPRAHRLEVGPDGYFAKDEYGNTKGGVRCVQMDIPHSTYRANPVKGNGRPSFLTVGADEPFDLKQLRLAYADSARYRQQFDRRLDELIAEGWLLSDDADEMRREAARLQF